MQDVRGKRIFLGLSGGVDSAVAAALLVRAGAQVTGVFIKGWYPPGMPCTWATDRRDAMRVAARLRVPFYTLDARDEYKHGVIDYLLAEYRAGRTPNPDVMCNREVKFGTFYRFAKAHDADAIATGHYVSGEKDQRYFLWAVPKEALAYTVFPLADKEKAETRALARRFGLPVAQKKDSQGVCFLGDISIEAFLKEEFGIRAGRAVTNSGEPVGTHAGAVLYTIGERVSLAGASNGPWYVIAKDMEANELTVAHERGASDLRFECGIPFSHENWQMEPHTAQVAQLRYRGPLVSGRVERNRFYPSAPLAELPTPGQSIVFYAQGILVGGGIIDP